MTDKILERLLMDGSISGQTLSAELGVTRAAVWKQIEQLRAMGFEIDALGRQGYRLRACPDSLMAPLISLRLKTEWAGRDVIYMKSLPSTNKTAREMAAEGAREGTLVIADEQTQGRGRRGRGWISPAGEGIFMSLILRPQGHPSQVARLSLQTALAVAEAIDRATGLDARIKWPNDIVCGGKKICGMLLEMQADEQSVHYVVAGIGINVHQKVFDREIAETASSLDLLCGRTIRRVDVVCAFLEAYEAVQKLALTDEQALMQAYRRKSATLGQRVQVLQAERTFTGTALEVTDSGSLLVCDGEGCVHEVLAADVSVRGVMGYV